MGVTTSSTVANTYVPLATTTLASATTTVTFSSIPSTYTDLIIVCNVASAASTTGTYIQFNTDTATNYSQTVLRGNGTSAFSSRDTNVAFINLNYFGDASTTSLAQTIVASVMNYANTTTYKTTISRGGNAESGTSAVVGLWRSTAAISTITLKSTTANNYATGSTFTLYGITRG